MPQDLAGHAPRTWNSMSVEPDADDVARPERDLAHLLAVDERAVAAAEVGEAVGSVLELELAVMAADQRVIHDHVVVARSPHPDERPTEIELDRPAGRRC